MTPSDFGLVVLACFFSGLLGAWLESRRSRFLRSRQLDDHAHDRGRLMHQLEVRRLECEALRRHLAAEQRGALQACSSAGLGGT